LLQRLPPRADAGNLLVGLPGRRGGHKKPTMSGRAIFPVDFFADRRRPDDFRTIAATNALNDVFAMGGQPLLALSVAALPGCRRAWCARSSRRRRPAGT
jgi:selenide,water dikinase